MRCKFFKIKIKKVLNYGQTGTFTQVHGFKINVKVMETLTGPMVLLTKVNGRKTKNMDKVYIPEIMVTRLTENGFKTK